MTVNAMSMYVQNAAQAITRLPLLAVKDADTSVMTMTARCSVIVVKEDLLRAYLRKESFSQNNMMR